MHDTQSGYDYELRDEQNRAVNMTKAYFEGGGTEFLWNAKPRFGKTLTAYDLVRRMGLKKVLIVTNRPSIANSWADDFTKFIGWRGDLCFVSETGRKRVRRGSDEVIPALGAIVTAKRPLSACLTRDALRFNVRVNDLLFLPEIRGSL